MCLLAENRRVVWIMRGDNVRELMLAQKARDRKYTGMEDAIENDKALFHLVSNIVL